LALQSDVIRPTPHTAGMTAKLYYRRVVWKIKWRSKGGKSGSKKFKQDWWHLKIPKIPRKRNLYCK
jgi:hypothetical protein